MDILKHVEATMDILYPSARSFSKFKELMERYEPKGLKVYDIEVASIMLAHNTSELVTFNEKDFEHIEEIELIKI